MAQEKIDKMPGEECAQKHYKNKENLSYKIKKSKKTSLKQEI